MEQILHITQIPEPRSSPENIILITFGSSNAKNVIDGIARDFVDPLTGYQVSS